MADIFLQSDINVNNNGFAQTALPPNHLPLPSARSLPPAPARDTNYLRELGLSSSSTEGAIPSFQGPTPARQAPPSLPLPEIATTSATQIQSPVAAPSPSITNSSPASDEDISLHGVPPVHPLGALLEVSLLAARSLKVVTGTQTVGFGLAAGIGYFTKFENQEGRQNTSEILRFLTEEDVNGLFTVFWSHLHRHCAAIDREHSSPSLLLQRSPALFNAICCVSGSYYEARPELLPLLREFAKNELGSFPMEKSLEFVQAQLLYLTFKPIPAGSYNMDTNWIRIGLAVRMAQDLNLPHAHLIKTDTVPAWRIKSMSRTWLLCTNLEKTIAVTLGKPMPASTTSVNTELLASDNLQDTRLLNVCKYHMLLERSLEATRALAIGEVGHEESVYGALQRQLDDWKDDAEESERSNGFSEHRDESERQIGEYRIDYYFAQLIIASITPEHSLQADSPHQPYALAKYQTSALSLLHSFRDDSAALGHSKYCSDSLFSYVTFAAISLLRSVQPQFRFLIIDKIAAGKLISKTATLLENAARSWDHLPYLQAEFLRHVLRARLPEFDEPPPRPIPSRLIPPLPNGQPADDDSYTVLPPAVTDETLNMWNIGELIDPTGANILFNWDDFWAAGVTTHPGSPAAV